MPKPRFSIISPHPLKPCSPQEQQQAADQTTIHPLTSLNSEEISLTVKLLRQNGLLNPQTYFSEISLQEANKREVFAWQLGRAIAHQALQRRMADQVYAHERLQARTDEFFRS